MVIVVTGPRVLPVCLTVVTGKIGRPRDGKLTEVRVGKLPERGSPAPKKAGSKTKFRHLYPTKAGGFEVRVSGKYMGRFETEAEAARHAGGEAQAQH